MFAHGFSTFPYVAVADCLAWRRNLFCCARADALLGITYSPSSRGSCSSDAYETPLDGHRLGNHISDQFDGLLAIRNRRRSAIRTAPFADLRHAGADLDFAIWHFAETGCLARLDGRDRFCCRDEFCPCSVQCAARLVDATGERGASAGTGGSLSDSPPVLTITLLLLLATRSFNLRTEIANSQELVAKSSL